MPTILCKLGRAGTVLNDSPSFRDILRASPPILVHYPKMSVDYLLHESSVGYAIFQVIHQPDTVGNRLKEVQDSVQVFCVDKAQTSLEEILIFFQDLAKFGKMIKLISFAPFQYDLRLV